MSTEELPIGVFDSGMGGLTVLKELCQRLPDEDFIYLGDTARLPYGTKSPQTVHKYSMQAADKLMQMKVKALVIACNTAASFSLDKLAIALHPTPVYGVIEPGAEKACEKVDASGILVLATEGTVSGGAYQRSILSKNPEAPVYARACPLWVTLAEQRQQDDYITRSLIEYYLQGFIGKGPSTVLLGCTHFPLFAAFIREMLGEGYRVVDSAVTTASYVASELELKGLLNSNGGEISFMATDGLGRFSRVGEQFLSTKIVNVSEVDL